MLVASFATVVLVAAIAVGVQTSKLWLRLGARTVAAIAAVGTGAAIMLLVLPGYLPPGDLSLVATLQSSLAGYLALLVGVLLSIPLWMWLARSDLPIATRPEAGSRR